MKLLFDQNISHRLINQIKDILPQAKQVRELGLENNSDKQIWKYAKDNDFTVVTFDGDFYDYSLVYGHPPKIIWIRTFNQTTKNVEHIIRKNYDLLVEFAENEKLACLEIIDNNT